MVGRKRLSTAVHEAQGSFKKNPQRKNKSEPEAIPGVPSVPDSIEADSVAVAKWFHICGLLSQMRVITQSDSDLIESYCTTYSLYRSSLEHVREHGQVIDVLTQHGSKLGRNPASVELHACMDKMLKLLAEMGLTPASRSKLHAAPKEEEADPFQQLLDKMAGTG